MEPVAEYVDANSASVHVAKYSIVLASVSLVLNVYLMPLLDSACTKNLPSIVFSRCEILSEYSSTNVPSFMNNRQNIRSEFNTAAASLEDYAAEYVKQSVVSPMEQSVKSVEDNISELRTTRANRSEMCQKLEKIQKEVQTLISRIHDIA